jgi:hypothetical protein
MENRRECHFKMRLSAEPNDGFGFHRTAAGAAFRKKKPQQVLQHLCVRCVPQEFLIAPDGHQTFLFELFEMMRKGGSCNIQFALNVADNEALRVGCQQKLHNAQPGFGSHSGQHISEAGNAL